MPFSPSAEAAFDGQKGVVAGIGRPSGLLGAIHVWQRVPKSLAQRHVNVGRSTLTSKPTLLSPDITLTYLPTLKWRQHANVLDAGRHGS